jgi:hypothetical protein
MFKFKKIASVLASTIMLTSTVALAAAANYPAPFVKDGSANAAIVYGTSNVGYTDLVAVADIMANLNSKVIGSTTTTPATVEGEAYELFTSSSPLMLNSTLDSVRQTISSSHLPTVLADGTFETTTNIEYAQRIILGSTPKLEFKQQPTSDNDPTLGFSLSTTPSTGYIYNATVTFNSNVNFTHADSIGETIDLFGQRYTVSGATTSTKLILLRQSQTLSLTSSGELSAEVTVDGKTYTVELVSATDTDARIKVTDSSGNSDTKTVAEDNSKTIQGLEVGLTFANEDTALNRIQADLTVGASRVTLQDGSAVKYGTDDTTMEGTQVEFEYANGTQSSYPGAIGKIIFQVTASDSDEDAFLIGDSFTDPIFGSFKVDFSNINAPLDSTTDRETFSIKNSGSDKMTLNIQSHDGTEAKTIYWAYNKSDAPGAVMTLADNNKNRIVVAEMGAANKSDYVVLSNTNDEGGLYQVAAIYNSSDGFADDYVELKNVFTGTTNQFKATAEGTITGVTEQGKTFTITYTGASTVSQEERQVRINSDETSSNDMILFPTITSSKGAKIAFYQPTTISLDNWAGTSVNTTGINFENGNGYTEAVIAAVGNGDAHAGAFNVSWDAGATYTTINGSSGHNGAAGAVGQLLYNITYSAASKANVYLVDTASHANIVRPALIILEEKDDGSNYQAMIVTLDSGYDGDSLGLGVNDVIRTWTSDALNDEVQMETDQDKYQEMDIWGSLITFDKSDSDQATADISYPDEQLEALVYMAEETAVITAGGTGSSGGTSNVISISDAEISSATGKDIIVVGGSCVNSVAATLLGISSPTCGAGWTTATTVGSGQFLIQTFDRGSDKVATLVAGYNAGDTTNAATFLTTQTVDTTVGKKYIGTSGTSATLATTTTTTDTTTDTTTV